MKVPVRLLLVCFFGLVGLQLKAQNYPNFQVKEDLKFLVTSIKTYNPALDRYNPNFDTLCSQRIRSIIVDSLSILEVFALVSEFCAFSNEGHFSIGNSQDTVYSGFYRNRYRYFPGQIDLYKGKVFLHSNFSEERSLKDGDEILSINQVPIEDVIAELRKYIPTDGDIVSYASSKIESGFNYRYYSSRLRA